MTTALALPSRACPPLVPHQIRMIESRFTRVFGEEVRLVSPNGRTTFMKLGTRTIASGDTVSRLIAAAKYYRRLTT